MNQQVDPLEAGRVIGAAEVHADAAVAEAAEAQAQADNAAARSEMAEAEAQKATQVAYATSEEVAAIGGRLNSLEENVSSWSTQTSQQLSTLQTMLESRQPLSSPDPDPEGSEAAAGEVVQVVIEQPVEESQHSSTKRKTRLFRRRR